MKLFLVRHAQTAHNRDGLGLGRADVPLTELGERQSKALASRLGSEPITRVFSSPLRRASYMAEAIAAEHDIDVELREELVELDIGHTEGLTFPEMHDRHADFMARWQGPDFVTAVMPGGESMADLAVRTASFLDSLRSLDEPAVAVVSHNFVTKVMVCQLLGIDIAQFRSFTVDVASMCTFVLRRGRVTVSGLNDCCHLDSLNMHALKGSLST